MTDQNIPVDQSQTLIARNFLELLPQARALGMTLHRLDGEGAEISLPWAEELVGDPHSGVIHGGVISTLMDTCCAAAVMAHPTAATVTATIDLRIDYMRPATPRQGIRARAECYHVTRSVAFVRAVATDDDESRPVATATGAFTLGR